MIKNIVDNFYFIERGWLNANHFVFNGNDKVLIDTGYKKNLDDTFNLIRQTGLDPAGVELIISTHGHCDHIGGNKAIYDLSGCVIAMHSIDRYNIEKKNDWNTWWRYFDQEAEFFPVSRSLEDGDVIMLDKLELIVIHTPGHASGMISLYSPEHRFLISSDAIWNGDFGVLNTRVEGSISPFLQQKSLEKLAKLDICTIYPGHGSIIFNAGKAIYQCQKRLEYFLEQPERIGRDLLKKIFLYTLLMKPGYTYEGLFEYILSALWFLETVDFYFKKQYRSVYEDIMKELIEKKLVLRDNERLVTKLKA
ncbi:MAG: MBL fold metallo-hydrolase [Bacillota bacterium]